MYGILIKMNLKEKNIILHNLVLAKKWTTLLATIVIKLPGADPRGGAHPARAPPKIGKKYDFLA